MMEKSDRNAGRMDGMTRRTTYYSVAPEAQDPGGSTLRVVSAGHFHARARYHVLPRVLPDEAVFIYTRLGEGHVRSGTEEFVALPGDAFLLLPGTEHEYRTHRDFWELLWFHCTGPLVRSAALDARSGCIPPAACGADLTVERCLLAVCDELERKALYAGQAASAHAHLALIALLRARHDRPSTVRLPEHMVGDALEYIHQNLYAPIRVSDLERRFNVSARHLARLFARHVGQSPKAYILNAKLAEAKRFLSTTDLSVVDVARQVGFSDPYYFSRLFHERTGKSPSAFRRERS